MSKEINGNANISFIAPINADKNLGIIVDKKADKAMLFGCGSTLDYAKMLSDIVIHAAKSMCEHVEDKKKVYELIAASCALGLKEAFPPEELIEWMESESEDDDE